jgi:neutral ceramidase
MMVGVARRDITPDGPIELSGFLARVQPSVGVHDRLYANALFLAHGGARVLWLHCDTVGFEHAFVVELKVELATRANLQPHEIVLSATHSHSGPATARLINCGTPDPAYLDRLRDLLVSTGLEALQTPRAAHFVAGECFADLAIERRGRPPQLVDRRLGVLAWRYATGDYAAVLTNYGMHNVGLSEQNRLVSADIAGRLAATLTAHLPGAPLVLATNGAAGNINPPAVTNDFAAVERWGDELAGVALAALERAAPQPETLWSTSELLRIPTVPLSPAELTARAAELAAPFAGRTGYAADRFRDGFARWAAQLSAGPAPTTLPLELQVVRIGPIDLVCVAAEVFSQMPGVLRAASDRCVYVVSYANGALGYLAPASAYTEGSYEVNQAFVWYGTPPIQPGAFELVRERAVQLLRRPWPAPEREDR